MKCEYCDNPVPSGATRCPSCGAAVSPQMINVPQPVLQQVVPMPKQVESTTAQPFPAYQQSRVGYIILGFLLGEIGVHNFYVGYVGRGVAQLLITVLSLGFLCWISWIWALVEIIVVSKNAKGIPLR